VSAQTSRQGRPFEPLPIDAVRQNSDDLAAMLEWFDRVGYSVDIPALAAKWDIRPMTLAEWAVTQKKK
jgi:hypothetical protein